MPSSKFCDLASSILEGRWTSTSCSAIRQCWCSNCWPRGKVRLKSNAPIESLRSDVATHDGWLSLKGIVEPRFQECFCWNRSCSVQVQPLFLFRSQRRRLVIEICFHFQPAMLKMNVSTGWHLTLPTNQHTDSQPNSASAFVLKFVKPRLAEPSNGTS